MSTPPPDDMLPARLRALSIISDGEQRVGRAWFRSMRAFLDLVRPRVTGTDPLTPAAVSDYQPFWSNEVDVRIVPAIGGVLRGAWRRVTNQGDSGTDQWVSQYLNEAGNRLRHIPDEVYGLIVTEVERGIREGLGIREVTSAVDTILTATGSDRWPNRARTVARTETMGAVNAGVFRAALLESESRGDPAPFKQWLSTIDDRTRPTHVVADKQRTLMTSPFQIGGSHLMFPGDPRGVANEVINCRCTMLPVVLGETIDWTNRQFQGGTDGA